LKKDTKKERREQREREMTHRLLDGEEREGDEDEDSGFDASDLSPPSPSASLSSSSYDEEREEAVHNSQTARLALSVNTTNDYENDESSSLSSFCWCFFIPIAGLVTFTVVATLIATFGIFTGLTVEFRGGIAVSPYPLSVTTSVVSDTNTDIVFGGKGATRFVAPTIMPLLASGTLPATLNTSSNDIVVPCQSNSQFYCPLYYRCSLQDSTCVFTMKTKISSTSLSECSASLSSQDVVNDDNGVPISGVYFVKESNYPVYVPLIVLVLVICTGFITFVLMRDIRKHEENKLGSHTLSFISAFRKHLYSYVSLFFPQFIFT